MSYVPLGPIRGEIVNMFENQFKNSIPRTPTFRFAQMKAMKQCLVGTRGCTVFPAFEKDIFSPHSLKTATTRGVLVYYIFSMS